MNVKEQFKWTLVGLLLIFIGILYFFDPRPPVGTMLRESSPDKSLEASCFRYQGEHGFYYFSLHLIDKINDTELDLTAGPFTGARYISSTTPPMPVIKWSDSLETTAFVFEDIEVHMRRFSEQRLKSPL